LGPAARRICAKVAKAGAAKWGTEAGEQAASIIRRISTSLQREVARSVLRRMPVGSAPAVRANPEAWAEDMLWQ
jgi:hypothetical protein